MKFLSFWYVIVWILLVSLTLSEYFRPLTTLGIVAMVLGTAYMAWNLWMEYKIYKEEKKKIVQ
ncbi:preprotein translocase subunit SecF [Croceifilum oryzae]|uniref:Preprotein translocase subunit SecF n=1 Tax=Croceifilum oryzae TaxID=1553429 RepID=A0AAJ1TH36_9BACL|nr:preprotein translocase subunit SecF [Croceifilum oryzae]